MITITDMRSQWLLSFFFITSKYADSIDVLGKVNTPLVKHKIVSVEMP